ncbi:hypothetical protein MUN82_08825 [Hymenobacter aerilatus]|uniref:Uncharacterized protein n=1 Tax=Hymenobacter aerilatus TaxID=2932251 RepID=A0A8T9T506_9BACT|nr:hypothetical protein [Hymenobacter aerilatus]UOR07186.1 hypothetical protein MUN82_08825 [Hymenobacter aerilatus]
MTPPTPSNLLGVPGIHHPQPQQAASFDPKAEAVSLRQQGYTIAQIATMVGRGTNMVSKYVREVEVPELPTLSLNMRTGVITLSDTLVKTLNLTHGQAIELEPGRLGRSTSRGWYLDLRPEAPARFTHTAKTRPQFRTGRKLPDVCPEPGSLGYIRLAEKVVTFVVEDIQHTGYKQRHGKPTSEKVYWGYYPLRLLRAD